MFKGGQVERQRFILYYAHSPNQWNHSGVLFHGHFHYIKMAPRIIRNMPKYQDLHLSIKTLNFESKNCAVLLHVGLWLDLLHL